MIYKFESKLNADVSLEIKSDNTSISFKAVGPVHQTSVCLSIDDIDELRDALYDIKRKYQKKLGISFFKSPGEVKKPAKVYPFAVVGKDFCKRRTRPKVS